MSLPRVGIVGWRGMVGSVLLERMREEGDLARVAPSYFSTSQAGEQSEHGTLLDAHDVEALRAMDIVITCQGGDYSLAMHPKLRASGWRGHWIDAASALRMSDASVIILDPLNGAHIARSLDAGVRDWIGGNCTVSLMLLAIHGLLREGWVEWVSSMTYQAASGAGAANMTELVAQMGAIARSTDLARTALELERDVRSAMLGDGFPRKEFGHPVAGSLLAWIDKEVEGGQSREEWKGMAEASKILGQRLVVDGTCVRIGAMRCHSQGLTVKLVRDVPLAEIEAALAAANPWVEMVANDRASTLARLTPAAIGGSLRIGVGRVRKLAMGGDYLNVFTVGDQLMWGAAEPLRRMLRILLDR